MAAKMLIRGEGLTVHDVYDVARNGTQVELDPGQLERVAASYQRVQAWGDERHPIYGVNTGFGQLVPVIVPPAHKGELQENLIRSHAAGAGEPFSEDVVRAIMLSRLNCHMKGYSGVSPETVLLMREFLNRGIHPVIPQQGSLGASGDLAPLSHMALALIGEGRVTFQGRVRPTAEVLSEEGLHPLTLGYKGGLTLINGTSAMTGAACIAAVRAEHLLRVALLASSGFVQCLRGSTGPFEDHGHVLKNHPGQITVAREMRRLLDGGGLTCSHHELMRAISERVGDSDEVVDSNIFLQDAYTLRAIPQILGPVIDTLAFCRGIIENELNSSNDNPLIFDVPERTFHGAHFHGQYVAMACDYLNIALAEIGVLAERQTDRLVNPNLNGSLPPFLADSQTGLFCGFEGGQYLATSIASENLDLAAPSSIKSIPSNGSNQDVVSMGTNSARRSLRMCENVGTILSVLMAACNQAVHIVGPAQYSPPIREVHGDLGTIAPQYRDERPLNEVLDAVRAFVVGEEFRERLASRIDVRPGRAA